MTAASCDSCRRPGACCRGFVLNFTVPMDDWYAAAMRQLDAHGIDYFVPRRPRSDVATVHSDIATAVMFDCSRLGPDGRCTDYENRPKLCRVFEAGSDPLCGEHRLSLRGIPIVQAA